MKTLLLLLCVAVVPSCKSPATVRDYFDLWFVVPKNPFLESNAEVSDGGPLTHESTETRTRRSLH